ncbi:hypothetical protein AA700_0192 [Acidiphilium acidophilum DSM 700]|nr:hypothetical protein AA700_0192 [Acidiphilium acidophilum DSM 700]
MIEVGRVKCRIARLVDHDIAGLRRQFIDDVMAVFAPHERATQGSFGADRRAGQDGAAQLAWRTIRQIATMPFARVDDRHPLRPETVEEADDFGNRRGELLDIEAGAIGVSAGATEVTLHIDDDESSRFHHEAVRKETPTAPRNPAARSPSGATLP